MLTVVRLVRTTNLLSGDMTKILRYTGRCAVRAEYFAHAPLRYISPIIGDSLPL